MNTSLKLENRKKDELVSWYADNFRLFKEQLNGNRYPQLDRFREQAISQFVELGFPTLRQEEWRYTDLKRFYNQPFPFARLQTRDDGVDEQILQIDGLSAPSIVFVDGQYSERLSTLSMQKNELIFLPFQEAVRHYPEFYFQQIEKDEPAEDAFQALNRAFSKDGIFLRFTKQYASNVPVHIIHLFTDQANKFAFYPQHVISVESGVSATIISRSLHIGGPKFFLNQSTRVLVQENANLDWIAIQDQSPNAYLFFNTKVEQRSGSRLSLVQFDLGGELVRNKVDLLLSGEHAESNLSGFYLTRGAQLVDNHTVIDHAVPNCQSNELFKGILADQSRGVFSGTVHVRPKAQKTNAFQQNKNLLLSDSAQVNTKPTLKIFADDVRCSHGATIGQMDEEAVFYMRQRGISLENARNLLRFAFASEVLDLVPMDAVRLHLKERLQQAFNELKD